MDFQSLIGQLSASSNPYNMALGMLPNNLKQAFSTAANSNSDQERAQLIADICNRNGITKEQFARAMKSKRF